MAQWQEYETIYLQPWCDGCNRSGEDRTWCRDNVWEDCEECGKKPVRYVLATVSTITAALEELVSVGMENGLHLSEIAALLKNAAYNCEYQMRKSQLEGNP